MQFEDLPPEAQAIIAEQQEALQRQQMEHHDNMNRLNEFMFGLSSDHALTLAKLLGMIGDSGNASEIANYFEGLVRGHMAAKFGVCPTHGIDHAAHDLAQITGSTETGDKVRQSYPTAPPRSREEGIAETELENMHQSTQLMDDLALYRVGFVDEIDVETEETFQQLRNDHQVSCVNCTQVYPSLADRMLKAPDDCNGCKLKAAHG